MKPIAYPYLPPARTIGYVSDEHPAMFIARIVALEQSLESTMPGAAVILSDAQQLVAVGANGSAFHQTNGCERARRGIKTGEQYELCEGCHPKHHSESTAIANAHATGKGLLLPDSTLYLWGHWWCCKACWTAMDAAGIANVILLEGSEVLFNREHARNIVGRQFAI